jgi:hypothetical protein
MYLFKWRAVIDLPIYLNGGLIYLSSSLIYFYIYKWRAVINVFI